MRANLVGVIAAASMAALSSCVYGPAEPARPYPYAAPASLAARLPLSYRACDRGPWLALGAWASNPFWPMGRRALRATRGAFATEAAKSCRSGGPPTGRKPTARGGLDQPGPRNSVRQPATCTARMTAGGGRGEGACDGFFAVGDNFTPAFEDTFNAEPHRPAPAAA